MNWNAVIAIGTCLGAFATLAAVLVSLWLAKKDDDKLQLFAGILAIAPANPLRFFVRLSAKNLSNRRLQVGGFYMHAGWFRKKHAVLLSAFANVGSSDFPKVIDYGESAWLDFELNVFFEKIVFIFKPCGLNKFMPLEWYLRSFRVSTTTPTKIFKANFTSDLIKDLAEKWRSLDRAGKK